MNQEKLASGTIILDQNGAEIGVIKKTYSHKLARLELLNSNSIAIDPTLVKEIKTSGRLIKKKSATIFPEAKVFFEGASTLLDKIVFEGIAILINHLARSDIKRALQLFEFDFLDKVDIEEKLPIIKALGFTRGIELAGKTPQDFIVKATFKSCEDKPKLGEIMAPEVVVDKLNQEKAFFRLLWNIQRIAVSQAVKLKEIEMVDACIDSMLDLGMKKIDTELKLVGTKDILYWQNRIHDCIMKYVALMITNLELTEQQGYFDQKRDQMLEAIKTMKVNSILKEETTKIVEMFDPQPFQNMKPIEALHSGIKGFNLKVMFEKKSMRGLLQLVEDFFENDYKDGKSLVNLRKRIDSFSREVRDVSKEYMNILLELIQYLKKIEYGDSRIKDYYIELMKKTRARKYVDINHIINKITEIFAEKT